MILKIKDQSSYEDKPKSLTFSLYRVNDKEICLNAEDEKGNDQTVLAICGDETGVYFWRWHSTASPDILKKMGFQVDDDMVEVRS